MNERDQAVLTLRNRGMSYSEIARAMGLTKNSVGGALRRLANRKDAHARIYRYSAVGCALGQTENRWEDQTERERIFAGVTFEDDPRASRNHGSPGRPIIGLRNGMEYGRAG